LGPTLKADHPDLSIMAFDHNKDHLEAWTAAMFPSPNLVDEGEEEGREAKSVTLDGEKVSLEGSGGCVLWPSVFNAFVFHAFLCFVIQLTLALTKFTSFFLLGYRIFYSV